MRIAKTPTISRINKLIKKKAPTLPLIPLFNMELYIGLSVYAIKKDIKIKHISSLNRELIMINTINAAVITATVIYLILLFL
ncbi:hypothetical protein CLOSBL3_10671 [Clostridiaceae bacterium BL-3]|nr:hypothetical protein CLOSBL3_10671 [Clostridiaceae bacterium BL-3]